MFVRQYADLGRYVLEIPAGMRDVADDAWRSPPRRELIEEIGCRAVKLELLTQYYTSAGMTDSVLHLYLATELHGGREVHGPEETYMEVLQLPLPTRSRWCSAARSTMPRR